MIRLIIPLTAFIVLLSVTSHAQIKNAKTEIFKINGNCGMCEKNIEKAGNIKNSSSVDWNKDTKMASITYDVKKTNSDEILKGIALAGYDSEEFLAPDDAYSKLPKCCQYERVNKTMAKSDIHKTEDHSMHSQGINHTATESKEGIGRLIAVFDKYFELKDALVQSDGTLASTEAKALQASLAAVKMDELSSKEHTVWMDEVKDLTLHAAHIAKTKDIAHQRDHFLKLSQGMYKLIKVSDVTTSVYYQHCPMFKDGKGAHWLSMENTIKNPYYGTQMLSCGKTVETIQ